MNELDWVRWIGRRAGKRRELILGIGDDCAIYRPPGASEDQLFTTDMLVEGVHFRTADPPDVIGHRALARGLSDIAACGGEPRFCLLSLARTRRHDDGWLKRFYAGLLELAEATGTVLAGGDLSTSDQLTCDVTVCGAAPRGQALRRSGAQHGDRIYVSGPLGASAAAGFPPLKFTPRLKLGVQLRGAASACIDITDGLALDLHRLCMASGLSADLTSVPIAPGATLEDALHGGEDYELLFTAPVNSQAGVEIGVMRAGPAGTVRLNSATVLPTGYDHFERV